MGGQTPPRGPRPEPVSARPPSQEGSSHREVGAGGPSILPPGPRSLEEVLSGPSGRQGRPGRHACPCPRVSKAQLPSQAAGAPGWEHPMKPGRVRVFGEGDTCLSKHLHRLFPSRLHQGDEFWSRNVFSGCPRLFWKKQFKFKRLPFKGGLPGAAGALLLWLRQKDGATHERGAEPRPRCGGDALGAAHVAAAWDARLRFRQRPWRGDTSACRACRVTESTRGQRTGQAEGRGHSRGHAEG